MTKESLSCMDLAGKVVLITGGGRGIGRGLALEMARAGADIALTYNASSKGAKEVAAEIGQLGRRVVMISADLSQVADARRAVTETVAAFSRLDVLVCNAGITDSHPFVEITEDEYDMTLDLNLKGAFFCTQEAVRAMIANKITGRIVLISSVHGFLSVPGHSHYAASKAGMNQFVRTVSHEIGPYGITINAIAPGAIEIESYREKAGYDRDLLGTTIPLGRVGYPRDVAGGVIFFASGAADYITGTVMYIDGGVMTRSPHCSPEETITYANLRPDRKAQA